MVLLCGQDRFGCTSARQPDVTEARAGDEGNGPSSPLYCADNRTDHEARFNFSPSPTS